MKRITALVIIVVLALSLFSCGKEEVASNRLETTAEEIAKTLPDKIDLSDMDCLTNEEDTLGLLEFVYGVSGDALKPVKSYFITNSHRSTDARAIAVIFFDEGESTAADIAAVQALIQDVYVKNLVNYTANYDPEQSKIASAASFKTYDNALVFASYDTTGNKIVFDAIAD